MGVMVRKFDNSEYRIQFRKISGPTQSHHKRFSFTANGSYGPMIQKMNIDKFVVLRVLNLNGPKATKFDNSEYRVQVS